MLTHTHGVNEPGHIYVSERSQTEKMTDCTLLLIRKTHESKSMGTKRRSVGVSNVKMQQRLIISGHKGLIGLGKCLEAVTVLYTW